LTNCGLEYVVVKNLSSPVKSTLSNILCINKKRPSGPKQVNSCSVIKAAAAWVNKQHLYLGKDTIEKTQKERNPELCLKRDKPNPE